MCYKAVVVNACILFIKIFFYKVVIINSFGCRYTIRKRFQYLQNYTIGSAISKSSKLFNTLLKAKNTFKYLFENKDIPKYTEQPNNINTIR